MTEPTHPQEIPGEVLTGSARSVHRHIERRSELEADVQGGSEPPDARPNDEIARTAAQREADDRFSEKQISALFMLAIASTIATCVAYLTIDQFERYGQYMNYAIGGGLGLSMLSIGSGMILWAKKLMPHEKAVQEREPFHSPEEDELETERIFFQGVEETQIGQRKLLRRTLIGAMGILPLPALFLLRDLGPLPGDALLHTGWRKGLRMVDLDTRLPVKLGEVSIGGIQTVMPEGFSDADNFGLAATILIRFPEGEIKSPKEANWGVENTVAYSKICTHAGCPISLYEQQTHHLLCPCHQSTFDMSRDAKVIFGPAARPLPQLRIYVDSQGYLRAAGDYSQPVGPSFWERR